MKQFRGQSGAVLKIYRSNVDIKYDGRNFNSDQKWNNDKRSCECKKDLCKKDYIRNPTTCSCENKVVNIQQVLFPTTCSCENKVVNIQQVLLTIQ